MVAMAQSKANGQGGGLVPAAGGAVAGICPSTEANLGDGIFDMTAWRSQGGRWGVGSDSHACVNAAEELMLLEYSQRLATRQRNVLARDGERDVATAMTLDAVLGGAQASGRAIGGLALGQQADFMVLDAQHPLLAALAPGVKALVGFVGFVVAFISLAALRNFGPVLFYLGMAIFGAVGLTIAGAILGAVI